MPMFSIIIPTFNASQTISDALNSIIIQQYINYEVLIIDGASSDQTVHIAKQFMATHEQIRIFSSPDVGIYDAMNKGIELAKGEWIYFLGADDSLADSSVLMHVSEQLSKFSGLVLYGNVQFYPSNRLYAGEFDLVKLLNQNICHQAIFYNRSVFKNFGNYNLEFIGHADWDFNLRLFEKNSAYFQFYNLLISNFNTGSTSSRHDILFLRNRLIPSRISHFNQEGIFPDRIKIYDEWWRIIRNSKIPWDVEFRLQENETPKVLFNIIKAQRNMSEMLACNGFVSKIIMTINYVKYRLNF